MSDSDSCPPVLSPRFPSASSTPCRELRSLLHLAFTSAMQTWPGSPLCRRLPHAVRHEGMSRPPKFLENPCVRAVVRHPAGPRHIMAFDVAGRGLPPVRQRRHPRGTFSGPYPHGPHVSLSTLHVAGRPTPRKTRFEPAANPLSVGSQPTGFFQGVPAYDCCVSPYALPPSKLSWRSLPGSDL